MTADTKNINNIQQVTPTSKPQVDPAHYGIKYDSKKRFISYWHQIHEVIALGKHNILEIGIGNGFVSDYLGKMGLKVTTVDIDDRLAPDITASVYSLPFADESFELVACYEVLEHLPYESFSLSLQEMYRVSKSDVIISLPDRNRYLSLDIFMPRIGNIKKFYSVPRFRKVMHTFDGEHYWEIGADGYSLERIISDIELINFKIINTYRIFEFPYHRYFVMQKHKRRVK